VVETPLYFKAMRVTLQPGGKSSLSAANGILYQLSGSTEISLGGENKVLGANEALFVAAGKTASLNSGSGQPSILLYFLLVPAAELGRPTATAPAAATELYQTVAPIPDLKPGGYDLNLTRVTFPAGMPSNPPHHRSGAALYYIVSGTGANTVDGTMKARGPDSLIYEPFGLVHQWGNPGSEPLTFWLSTSIRTAWRPSFPTRLRKHNSRGRLAATNWWSRMPINIFNTFDDPSASTGTTDARGVNSTDQIVGDYSTAG
jgi:quercetin dioxygenase-like cupin family protein